MLTTTLSLVDGVQIVVPDSLEQITPYVLREQLDWFEAEVEFLRHVLQPGQKVIDIGANCGVYTLSMAHTVGPAGKVWAFEPASGTADLLAEGIAANGYGQVVLERFAVSDVCGAGRLALGGNSELNALADDDAPADKTEPVTLITLDACLASRDWDGVAFVKIDAEGEEANIVKAGRRFFAEQSPLVQYEVRVGSTLHLELVQDFAALGYDSYRLVPGLDLLVPFDAASPRDGYLLNLFCCKPDRARQLAADGFLLQGAVPESLLADQMPVAYGWRLALGGFPYGARLAGAWETTMAEGHSDEMGMALSQYAMSRDTARSAGERYGALEAGVGTLAALCKREPSYMRLASLARMARDFGVRSLAVYALQQLSDTILKSNQVDPNEPFLAPGVRFDTIVPGEGMGNWILAAVLEELECLDHLSSFYAGRAASGRLETIRALGFGSAEMGRRLSLLHERYPH